MSVQPLFFAPPVHEKVAGYKLPTNPRFWQSEIIRYLKSQHPYLPMDNAEIDLRRMDAAKGAAVGSVILGKELAIPIIINRPRPGSDPELAPMDVFFYKGRYRYLDPEAIKSVTHTPQIGEPEKDKDSRAFGGNPYIGDVTGDATPLEYSGQASPFAGPYDGAKMSADISRELLPEYMLKDAENKKRFEKMKPEHRAALSFGTMGAIASPLHMVGDWMEGKPIVHGIAEGAKATKGQLAKALGKKMGRGAVIGASAAYLGTKVLRRLGMDRSKLTPEQKQEINTIIKQSDFTAGLESVLAGGFVTGLIKNAYIDPNDISNFRQMLATNPQILQGLANNLRLVETIIRRGPTTTMATGTLVKRPNIMQVYNRDGVVYIKFSGGPEAATTTRELKRAVGDRFPEVVSKLRAGGVYMEHDGVNQVTWDVKRPPMEAKPVTSDGLYAVRTRDGENLVGMVVQAVMDTDGKTLPVRLFVTPEGKYAMTKEMFGVRLASKHRLLGQVPQGGQSGVFVNYVHGTPIATLPLRLVSVRTFQPEDGDARVLYIVQEPMTGLRFTLSPVRGVQGFERMHVIEGGVRALADGPVYYMPGDSEWVTLKNPVKLAESAEELRKLSAVEDATHVHYSAGMWHVDNAHDLSEPEAREMLVAMGMDVDGAVSVVKQAHVRDGIERGVKIAGLHAPQMQGHEVIAAPHAVYDQETIAFATDCRPDAELLKAAAESGHPETLDALLSLEFITPQNLRYFIDNVPDFDETATRLAALLISIRLGLPHVPEQPVRDALEGLSKTVGKLQLLKSSVDHQNERATTAT